MNVGWVGLGKLGLPCALVLDRVHDVKGTDVSQAPRKYLADPESIPYVEAGLAEEIEDRWPDIWVDTIDEVVSHADVVFCAVQTPHAPRFEGDTPMPDDRADFDYTYLTTACRQIAHAARRQAKTITLVVVSTVLPGTTERLLAPLARGVRLAYSPAFIAMGTAMADFADPEMVLVGGDPDARADVRAVHEAVHDSPIVEISIASAELAKVAYNTYIGQKVVFANTVMELAHKTAADCDEVWHALSHATDRLHSPRYLRGGMGDGGGCHPRDNIAMSWLARRVGMSVDWFTQIMQAREAQSDWLAHLVAYHAEVSGLGVFVMGKAYKAGVGITVGSPATLLAGALDATCYDPIVDDFKWEPDQRAVYVIATNHPEFAEYRWPEGSIVVDPWGYIPDRVGVNVVRVGRKS